MTVKLRKQYYRILVGGRYLIIMNQLVANEESYEACVKEYNGDDVLVKEYIRPKTSPFFNIPGRVQIFLAITYLKIIFERERSYWSYYYTHTYA